MVEFGLLASDHRKAVRYAPERGSDGADARRGRGPDDRLRIAVTLIDDRTLFGESLAMAVNAQASDLVVTHWRSGQALSALRDADVVLVCIGHSSLSKGSTYQLLKTLLREDAHPPVAVLADAVSPSMIRRGMALRLDGIIASTVSLGAVMGALRQIHSGATVLPNMH